MKRELLPAMQPFRLSLRSGKSGIKATFLTVVLLQIDDNAVTGWIALTPVSGRRVYAGVAEVSVYVGTEHRGKGIGKLLLEKLIQESELKKISGHYRQEYSLKTTQVLCFIKSMDFVR